ncbi:MFS transporter [Kutzneria sp. NPDC052558]|uniref:MFS transporter n=1 Tax=Kutzneria sp. NPDC052558 TaxID=3364121 RepID=UPI0037CBD732
MTTAVRLPGKALLGLFLTGFVGILTECLPAGLLPDMARSLDVSTALTGQTVTLYAAATSIAAIPLSHAFSRWPRKQVLLTALITLAVTNTLTALSDSYPLTLVIRFAAGLGTALIWPQLGGYAARLAPAGQQGRAITVALAGTPIGLALGVPLGAWLSALGWQVAFYSSAGLTVLTLLWTLATLPNLPGLPPGRRPKVADTLVLPGLRVILFATAAYMVAHNILYTYVSDFLRHVGMAGQTGTALFVLGVTSVLSTLVVGAHIDRQLRKLVVGSTGLFAVSVLVMAVLSGVPALVYIAVGAWGFAFGSAASLFIAAAIDAAGEAAQPIIITVISGSIAAGGLLGGLLIADLGPASLTWSALALLVAATAAVAAGRRHAFPRNDR